MTTIHCHGSKLTTKTIPPSGVVWAPTTWRGHRIHVLIPDSTATIRHHHDNVHVVAQATYHRVATPSNTATGPCQIRVGEEYAGRDAVLVKGDANR